MPLSNVDKYKLRKIISNCHLLTGGFFNFLEMFFL